MSEFHSIHKELAMPQALLGMRNGHSSGEQDGHDQELLQGF